MADPPRKPTPAPTPTPIPTVVDLGPTSHGNADSVYSSLYLSKEDQEALREASSSPGLRLQGDAALVTPYPPFGMERLSGTPPKVSPHTLVEPLDMSHGECNRELNAREKLNAQEDAKLMGTIELAAKGMIDMDPVAQLKKALKDGDTKLATFIVSQNRVLRQIGEVLWGKHPWGTWTEVLDEVPRSHSHLADFDYTAHLKFTPYVGEHLHGVKLIFERIIQVMTILRKYPDDVLDLVVLP